MLPSARPGGTADQLTERGDALVRAGQSGAALIQYTAALALQPDCFEAHANLGMLFLALRRHAEAEAHLCNALLARPREAPLHLALGRACLAQGRFGQAEAYFRRALAINPGLDEAALALGGQLRRRGRFAAAEACYRRVLGHQPRHALALYALGHCLRERGRTAQAADSFERAIQARPDYVDAHYRLAVLRPNAPGNPHLAQLEALQPRVADLPPAQQVRYWFALGRRREDAADYVAAFAAYAKGNALQYRRLRLADTGSARETLEARFIERIQDTFSGAWLGAAKPLPCTDARDPVFIVGMPRSGTSLIEQMLAAHPDVHGGGELPHLPAVLKAAFGFEESPVRDSYPEIVPTLAPAVLARPGRTYLDLAWRQASPARRVTDKLTGNFLHAGMLQVMLPRARIIHMERAPRDACFSCFANLFRLGDMTYSYDLGALGRHCLRQRRLMAHWHAVLPAGRLLTVRYEDLVAEPETVLRRVLRFLDLPWNPRCLAFHRQRRAVHTVSVGQVRQPVYATSVARWRHFAVQLQPLLDILEAAS
jgi:Flp pilus assembly protein TadD